MTVSRVKMDKVVLGIWVIGEAKFENVGMEHLSLVYSGSRFEEGREGELVGRNTTVEHERIESERVGGTDERVVDKWVRAGKTVEEGESVVYVPGRVESTELDGTACSVIIVREAEMDEVCVILLEFLHIEACVQALEKR